MILLAGICWGVFLGLPRTIASTMVKSTHRNLLLRTFVIIATAVVLIWPGSKVEPSLVTNRAVQRAQLTGPLAMQPLNRLFHRLPFSETMSVTQTTATLVGVVLPTDGRPGEKMSGRVVTDPKKYAGIPALRVVEMELPLARGEDGRATLQGLVVDLGDGRAQPADGVLTVEIPRNADRIQLSVRREGSPTLLVRRDLPIGSGRPLGTTAASAYQTSPIYAAGGVLAIRGPLDGNGNTTDIRVNDQQTTIIAETPRAVYFLLPDGISAGVAHVTLSEGLRRSSFSIAVVRIEITADRLQLVKGEQTPYHVVVSGPEGLSPSAWRGGVSSDLVDESNVSKLAPPRFRIPSDRQSGVILLRIENTSPETVSIEGAQNEAVVRTLSREDFVNGPYRANGVIRARRTGGFLINATVVPFLAPVTGEQLPTSLPQREPTTPRLAKIVGYKFNDLNGNGIWNRRGENPLLQGSEPPLAGWTITLSGPENQTTTTDSTGRFEFTVHTPGTYTISEEKRDGWRATTAASATVQVRLIEGETFAELPFGESTIPRGPGTTTTTPPTPICQIKIDDNAEPKMDGGLTAFSKSLTEINRDDFIPLEAEGRDFDKVVWSCTPSDGCEETPSEREAPLTGRVKFSWEIIEGEGSFKKLGCLPDGDKEDEGEHVIFQPPYVPLPGGTENKKLTKIRLLIIDDNPTQPKDDDVPRTVTIETTRNKAVPDKYFIKITSEAYTLPSPPAARETKKGTCEASNPPDWKNDDDFVEPTIKLPSVKDGDKMVVGEMMILEAADQRDKDEFNVKCKSQRCTPRADKKLYEDDVEFNWRIVSGDGTGKILGSPKGRFIIYQAPMSMPESEDKRQVKIVCEVINPLAVRIDDKTKKSEPFAVQIVDKPKRSEITFYAHNAGVKLDQVPGGWLPEDANDVTLTSSLKYKDGTEWKDALAHQCRIHFFELRDVSTEPGVCLNKPIISKADKCVDLDLKNEGQHEAFKAPKITASCNTKDLFQEARTQLPVKEYKIKVYSRDFGSYGFLRSYANINTNPEEGQVSGSPQYYSIGVKSSEVTHPQGRPKKKEYKDNRVTIPLDIDENHIADGGWTATDTGAAIPDPADVKADEDDKPVGDGGKGDGFSNYEEFRGFYVLDKKKETHIRLDNTKKDLFIHNRDELNIELFRDATELAVHEITQEGYATLPIIVGKERGIPRVVNFNYTEKSHSLHQKGIYLIEEKKRTGDHNLGITRRIGAVGDEDLPAPPNFIGSVTIFTSNIADFVGNINKKAAQQKKNPLKLEDKIKQIVAHELSHACNVYHHGEPDPLHPVAYVNGIGVPDENNLHGIRSGETSCIMRYDNWNPPWDPAFFPETIGNKLCKSEKDSTGYNVNERKPGFGDADKVKKRGNCLHQIR